jgi:hypothetical protein
MGLVSRELVVMLPSPATSIAVRFHSVHIRVVSRGCKFLKHPVSVTTTHSVTCLLDIFVPEVCHQGTTGQQVIGDPAAAETGLMWQTETTGLGNETGRK